MHEREWACQTLVRNRHHRTFSRPAAEIGADYNGRPRNCNGSTSAPLPKFVIHRGTP